MIRPMTAADASRVLPLLNAQRARADFDRYPRAPVDEGFVLERLSRGYGLLSEVEGLVVAASLAVVRSGGEIPYAEMHFTEAVEGAGSRLRRYLEITIEMGREAERRGLRELQTVLPTNSSPALRALLDRIGADAQEVEGRDPLTGEPHYVRPRWRLPDAFARAEDVLAELGR